MFRRGRQGESCRQPASWRMIDFARERRTSRPGFPAFCCGTQQPRKSANGVLDFLLATRARTLQKRCKFSDVSVL
jgi:hypothetical protein